MTEKPKPYTGTKVLHTTAETDNKGKVERLPTTNERWAWRDSPSRPGFFKKRREERRGG